MRIGSGWKKKSKNNTEYFSLAIDIPLLGSLQLAMFREQEKKGENSPDYSIVWSPERKGKGSGEQFDDDIPL